MATWADCMQTVSTGGVDTQVPTLKCGEVVFERILQVTLPLVGIALFVMFVIGGTKLLTSGGNPETAAEAKKTMTYAVGGLALMALAFLIFRLIEYFTKVPVTNFVLPDPNTP